VIYEFCWIYVDFQLLLHDLYVFSYYDIVLFVCFYASCGPHGARTQAHGRTVGRSNGRTLGRSDGHGPRTQAHGRTLGQSDGRTDVRTLGRTDGRSDRRTADGRTVGRSVTHKVELQYEKQPHLVLIENESHCRN
jgi:hypothetical protein